MFQILSKMYSLKFVFVVLILYTVFVLVSTQYDERYTNRPCIYLYIIIVGFFLVVTEVGVAKIQSQQKRYNTHYQQIDDMNRCPQTVAYLTHFQSMFNTYPFGMAVAGANSLAMLVILYAVHVHHPKSLAIHSICIICVCTFLMTFAWIYKVTNCILGRICGGTYCADTYFKNGARPLPAKSSHLVQHHAEIL